jgi:hypothetical protein
MVAKSIGQFPPAAVAAVLGDFIKTRWPMVPVTVDDVRDRSAVLSQPLIGKGKAVLSHDPCVLAELAAEAGGSPAQPNLVKVERRGLRP